MAIEFDHTNKLINITAPQDTLSCQDLIDAIRTEEATATGITYPQIATASGKESLGEGVYVGMTVNLLSPWQVKFWSGNYIAKISGGNLVGGISGDPVAYSAGVQVLLVQSAASTVVVTSDGLNAAQEALLQTAATEATAARKMVKNDAITNEVEDQSTILDDDGITPYYIFNHPTPKERRGQ